MKQIGRELWAENCGGMGVTKLLILFGMIFGSVFLRDYPYSIVGTYLLVSLEITILKLYGQIDFFLPQTAQERKQKVIIKSVLVAGLYSVVNTISYVWLVCRKEDSTWNMELIIFMVYMTAIIFLYFFTYRVRFFCVGSKGWDVETKQKKGNDHIAEDILASFGSVFFCLLYIMYRFGNLDVGSLAAVLDPVAETMPVWGLVIIALDVHIMVKCIREIDFSEYGE